MTMTLQQAVAFRLPSGKAMGEAVADDWSEADRLFEADLAAYEKLDPATMTQEDRERIQASLERGREFDEALAVIKEIYSGTRRADLG